MSVNAKPIPSNLDELFKEEDALKQAEKEVQLRQERVKAAKKILMESSNTHLLAIKLHDKWCRWNHTDGCGWHYAIKDGVHDWSESSHQAYLRKAHIIMKRLENSPVTCDNILGFIDELSC